MCVQLPAGGYFLNLSNLVVIVLGEKPWNFDLAWLFLALGEAVSLTPFTVSSLFGLVPVLWNYFLLYAFGNLWQYKLISWFLILWIMKNQNNLTVYLDKLWGCSDFLIFTGWVTNLLILTVTNDQKMGFSEIFKCWQGVIKIFLS